MKISKQNVANIRKDAHTMIALCRALDAKKRRKAMIQVRRVFESIDKMLPDSSGVQAENVNWDQRMSPAWMTRVLTGDMIFVKQKVMRKIDKKWLNATTKLCDLTRECQRDKVNGVYVGFFLQEAVMRMVWLNHWMIAEINRQIDDHDPELEELWQEQKAEEGL